MSRRRLGLIASFLIVSIAAVLLREPRAVGLSSPQPVASVPEIQSIAPVAPATMPEPEARAGKIETALERAEVVEARTLPPDAEGVVVKQRVIRWHGKYPLLRIEEDVSRDPLEKGEPRVMVADHLMVTLREGFSEEQLQGWVNGMGFKMRRHLPGTDVFLIGLPSGSLAGFDAMLKRFNEPGLPVEMAEPDALRFAATMPNDTSFAMQWALHNSGQTGGANNADVNATEAWEMTRGDASLVVAVLDSGIDLAHPDLQANVWVNSGEIPNNRIDDDQNGVVDDVNGWNFYSNNRNLGDLDGHGTHCAGVIGAMGDNAAGVSGIAPLVKIMPLRVMDDEGAVVVSDAIEALNYAVAMGSLVTSNSYGGAQTSALEKRAINAAKTAGVLFVCSAGNGRPGRNIDIKKSYPASFDCPNIISVAASTSSDGRPSFSHFGVKSVDIAAPGVGILSTLPGGTYGYESGTSMACPLVAGACVLVKAAHPELGWEGIKSALLNSVDRVPAFKGKVKSGGRLNVARAVLIGAMPRIDLVGSEINDGGKLGAGGNGDGVANAGEDVAVEVTIKNVGPTSASAVTTTLSVRQNTPVISVIRGSIAWGDVAAGASLKNGTRKALPFVVRVAPGSATQTVALLFTHADDSGHTWVSDVPMTIAGTQTLTGAVAFLTGGKPVKGATISYTGPVSGTVPTGADGRYSLNLPDGTYVVTAHIAGYASTLPTTITVPPATAELNFAIGKPVLNLSPDSLSVSQPEQSETTKTLAVTNSGDVPLTIAVQNSSLGNAVSKSFYNVASYGAASRGMAAQAVHAPLPWQEGFESGISSLTPSRYHELVSEEIYPYIYYYVVDFYKGASSVVSNTAAVGQRSLQYRDPLYAGFANGLQKRFAKGSQPRYISYWVRPGDTTGTSGCFSLENGYYDRDSRKWFWDPIIQVTANEGGTLSANGMLPSGDKTVPFAGKTWHQIELRNLNWQARTFDYWVNGQFVKSAIGFQGYATEALRVHVYNDTVEGESWWDELRVLEQDDVWLSHAPDSLTIAPGETRSIDVTASAVAQRPGTYRALLNLISNDPVHPTVNVPVTMTVTPRPNTAPVALSQTVTLLEDEVKQIVLPVTDNENDDMIVNILTLPTAGTLSLTAGGHRLNGPVALPVNQKTVFYTPAVGAHGARVAAFTYKARDSRLSSLVATIALDVADVNDAPALVADYLFLSSGVASVSKNVLSNDRDEELDAFQIISLSTPAKGTVEDKGNGVVLYTPGAGFVYGEDHFTYTVQDARGASSTGSVWVNKASSVSVSGTEDTDLPITLTGPDATTDTVFTRITQLPAVGVLFQTPDGVAVGAQITGIPTNVTNTQGMVVFRPVADGNGNIYASFKFDVSHEGQPGAVATASISIAPVPDAPRAVADRYVVTAGQAITRSPLSNDTDVDGEALTIISVSPFPHGTATINAQGAVDITTDPLAGGSSDTFSYVVADPAGLTSTGWITLVFKGTSPDAWPTFGGGPDHRGYVPTALGTNALSKQWGVSVGSNASPAAVSNGKLFVTLPVYFADTAVIGLDAATGAEIWRKSYEYAPSMNPPSTYAGDVFVQVQDGPGQASHLVSLNEATGNVRWSSEFSQQWSHYLAPAVDETGVFINCGTYGGIGSYNTETGAQRFFLGLDQYDGWTPTLHNGRVLSFVKGTFRTHHLNTGAVLASRNYSWNWAGYTMNRTVACLDDVAYFINDPTAGGRQLIALSLDTLTDRWTYNNNTALTGTPAIGANSVFALAGTNVVELDLSSGNLLRTYTTGGTDPLLVQPVVTADSLVVSSSSKTFLFTLGTTSPRQTLPVGGNVSVASRSVFITDQVGGVHRFGIFDTSTNPSPMANAATLQTNEDTAVTVTLSGTDSQPLRFVVDTLPAQGIVYQTADGVTKGTAITRVPSLVADATGRVIYEPSLNSFGAGIGNFTFRAHDGNSPSAQATMTLNVIGVNDAPVAINDRFAIRVGQSKAGFKPQFNDRDADGDILTITSFTQPSAGTVTSATNGGVTFVPSASFTSGSTTFDYTVNDSAGGSATAKVTIIISDIDGTNWPTFGAGPDHTGFVPVLLDASPLTEVWATASGTSTSPIAVANGRIFLTLPTYHADTAIVALDTAVGGELWRKTYLDAASINPPTWHNGEVIVQVQDGPSQLSHVVSLNDADGSQRWASPFSQQWEHYMAPAVDDTGIYVAGGSYGGIYGYSRHGAQKFFVPLDQQDQWTPNLHGGGLYSYQYGKLRSHDLTTGAVKWTKALGPEYGIGGAVACSDGFGYLINEVESQQHYPQPRDLSCINLGTQALVWTVRNPAFRGTPAVAHDSVFALSSPTTISSYDTKSGVLLSTFTAPTTQELIGQPVITDDTVIVSNGAQTYCFDLQTSALRQTLSVGGSVCVAGHSVFVASSDGKVHCFQSIDPSNPTPIASAATVTTNEDTPVEVTLSATDTQAGSFKYQVSSLPSGQLFQVTATDTVGVLISKVPALVTNAAGKLMYLPPQDRSGNALAAFTFKASDGNTLSVAATITINVLPVNDAPIAMADERQVRPGDILSPLHEKLNDVDADGDVLTVTSFTQPAIGTVAQNSDGTLRYESSPVTNSGTTTFSYTISDPAGFPSTATVTIAYVPATAGSWPTFGNGPEHTGYSPAILSRQPVAQRWSHTTEAGSRQVATGEGKVFVTSISASTPWLTALDERTGAVLWKKNVATTSGYATGAINSPTYYDGDVYLQNGQQGDARITCVSAADGAVLWSKPVGCQWGNYMAPAVNAQGVFINAGSYGGMYGFSHSGTELFFLGLPQYDQWTPSLHQGGLYSFTTGTFRSHNPFTGAELWSLDLGWNWSGYSMYRTVAFSNGRAYLVNSNPGWRLDAPVTLTCIDLVNRVAAWQVPGSYVGTPAISNGVVFAASPTAYAVEARNASDGSLLRSYNVSPSSYFSGHHAPIVTDDLLIVPNSLDTRIFGRYDGELLQTIPLAGEVAVSDDAIIISADDRVASYAAPVVIVFSPASGTFPTAKNIKITAADTTATLHYTTDGTAPNLSSPSIASGGSVLMDHTGKLRAISVKGSAISRIFEASFTIGGAPLAAMSRSSRTASTGAHSSADADRDGQSDLAEAVAGTDPQNSADVFKVKALDLVNSGTAIRITWASKADRNYRVQCSTDMQSWADITASLSGTGGTMSHELTRPADSACFLRVRVEQ